MARTKLNQRSANREVPMGATGGRTPPSKLTVALFGISIVAAIWALAMMTSVGRVAYVYFFAYAEFYMGVLTLVSLSITIMLGLVSTDRLVLSIRQRVLLQSAHRTFGIIAVGALALHLWTKLMEAHIGLIDIFIPFLHAGNTLYVGLGTISAWILVTTMWTGIVRAKFIGRGKPWMWRSIHATSYLMWPIALVHGLAAGRAAATWVIVSYVVCILGVLLGLAVRISVSLNRKKDFASQAGTGAGAIKPVGQLVPTTTPPAKKRGGRRTEMEGARGGTAVLDRWEPAAPPAPPKPAAAPAMTGPPPISAPPYDDEQAPPRRRRPRRDEEPADYAEPRGRRPRQYEDEDDVPAPRQRQSARAERFDEETGFISRRAIESSLSRYDDDEVAPPRPRRRAEEEPPPRRRASEQRYEAERYEPEPEPRPRARRYADEEPPPRRREIEAPPAARRYADEEPPPRRRYDEEPEPAPRARRYADDDRYDEAPRPRGPRYPEDPPPPPPGARRGRDRREDVDRADSGRHSRSEFVDLAAQPPAENWRDQQNYMDPDDTPTLVDMASRRARRASQQEAPRGTSRGARRGRGRNDEMADDDGYWRQLRGEAQ